MRPPALFSRGPYMVKVEGLDCFSGCVYNGAPNSTVY